MRRTRKKRVKKKAMRMISTDSDIYLDIYKLNSILLP